MKLNNKKQIPVLKSMKKTRDTRYLKNYTLEYSNTAGEEKIYETVSNFDYTSPEQLGESVAGVVIVGTTEDKLLLCKEFRMGVNHFVYNLPAGHIDPGETIEQCASRELYEETGLNLDEITKVLPPSYASPDLSDSSCYIVFAKVSGSLEDHTEADEWIEPCLVSKDQVKSLLEQERFSGRAQLIAYYFCQ